MGVPEIMEPNDGNPRSLGGLAKKSRGPFGMKGRPLLGYKEHVLGFHPLPAGDGLLLGALPQCGKNRAGAGIDGHQAPALLRLGRG